MQVNLFIVGEQKSGTTTLHYLLNQHPNVLMSKIKEPGYFCTDFHEESDIFHGRKAWFPIRTLKQYLKIFTNYKSQKVVGEASSTYLYSKAAAKNIHKYNRNAKIIILLREPVAFLHSLHSQYIKETSESEEDFENALKAESFRKNGKKLSNRARCPSLLFYNDRVKYSQNIKRYTELFKQENIKIIIAEEFRKESNKTVREVFDFLGVERNIKVDVKNQNVNKVLRFKWLHNLLNSPVGATTKSFFIKKAPSEISAQITSLLHKYLRKESKRPKLNTKTKEMLKKRFAGEVEDLNKVLKENEVSENIKEIWSYN